MASFSLYVDLTDKEERVELVQILNREHRLTNLLLSNGVRVADIDTDGSFFSIDFEDAGVEPRGELPKDTQVIASTNRISDVPPVDEKEHFVPKESSEKETVAKISESPGIPERVSTASEEAASNTSEERASNSGVAQDWPAMRRKFKAKNDAEFREKMLRFCDGVRDVLASHPEGMSTYFLAREVTKNPPSEPTILKYLKADKRFVRIGSANRSRWMLVSDEMPEAAEAQQKEEVQESVANVKDDIDDMSRLWVRALERLLKAVRQAEPGEASAIHRVYRRDFGGKFGAARIDTVLKFLLDENVLKKNRRWYQVNAAPDMEKICELARSCVEKFSMWEVRDEGGEVQEYTREENAEKTPARKETPEESMARWRRDLGPDKPRLSEDDERFSGMEREDDV